MSHASRVEVTCARGPPAYAIVTRRSSKRLYFGFTKSARRSARLRPSLLGADGNETRSRIAVEDFVSLLVAGLPPLRELSDTAGDSVRLLVIGIVVAATTIGGV